MFKLVIAMILLSGNNNMKTFATEEGFETKAACQEFSKLWEIQFIKSGYLVEKVGPFEYKLACMKEDQLHKPSGWTI